MNRLNAIISERCKRSFYYFVKEFWDIVEPGSEYKDNWHIELICKYLEATVDGRIKNLIINIPPRHMKSLLVGVFFPAWVFIRHPEKKFLCASYSANLAIRDNVACRNLVSSYKYKTLFRHVKLVKDQNQKHKFQTTQNGFRMGIGVGGGATGEGGDWIIVDDPIKADNAYSSKIRDSVNFWWDNTMSTRLNDPNTGVKIIIQQRLHEDDLVGHILKTQPDKWEALILPFEYEGERYKSSIGLNDKRSTYGEILWPNRFDRQTLDELKKSMSSIGVAGQLQQRPFPETGAIFKKEWFKPSKNKNYIERFMSWDTASTINVSSAYSTCIIGDVTASGELIIRHVYRDRLEFPDLLKKIDNLAEEFFVDPSKDFSIVIEDKSSGTQLLQTIKRNSKYSPNVFAFQPKGDKVSRAMIASVFCENGKVFFSETDEDWLEVFKKELFSFPNSSYRDQVDAFTQLVYFTKEFLQ